MASKRLVWRIPPVDELIPCSVAASRILASCTPLSTERVALADAAGRVLAIPLVADRPLPPYARSMMDGIAFASEDAGFPATLSRAGLHAAGDPPPRALEPGEAWEIMTGAAVPGDCDVVVPYEELEAGEGTYALLERPRPGQCIHPVGLDAAAGDQLVSAGSRIGPAEVAIAASVGAVEVDVRNRARVAVLTTGDEAIPPSSRPESWQIRRSNGPMLAAALGAMGHAPVAVEHVADDNAAAKGTLDRLLGACDVLLLCGGISRGKKDFVRRWIEEHLGAPAFHGVKQRPGKPMAFWPGPHHVFALPGNPVSVLATFARYVRPALAAMEGEEFVATRVRVDGVERLRDFTWLLPVAVDATGSHVPRPPKNSGDFASLAGSVGIIEIAPSTDAGSDPMFPLYPFS